MDMDTPTWVSDTIVDGHVLKNETQMIREKSVMMRCPIRHDLRIDVSIVIVNKTTFYVYLA